MERSNRRDRKNKGSQGGPECRVFVGNLSFKVTDEIMREHFGSCGRVLSVDFITDRTTGKFYGTAFVEFSTPEGAQKALSLDGQKLLGRPTKVQRPKLIRPSASSAMPGVSAAAAAAGGGGEAGGDEVQAIPGCRSVFVSRLPRDITEEEVCDEFQSVGPIASVRWVPVKQASPVCCCFVEFEGEDAAVAAVKKYNGLSALRAHGQLRVNLAPDRPLKKFLKPAPGEDGADDGESGARDPETPRVGLPKVYDDEDGDDAPPAAPPPAKQPRRIVFHETDE